MDRWMEDAGFWIVWAGLIMARNKKEVDMLQEVRKAIAEELRLCEEETW